MNSRQFGGSGVEVSEIGLGCWQIGGADWGDVTEAEGLAILRASAECGVTFFDTADVYGSGWSETVIGRFLKDLAHGGLNNSPSNIFIATKLGRNSDRGWPGNFEPETMRRHIEASLGRLGLETLDLAQLHCVPTEVMRRGDVFETLRELRAEGKIRHFGASVESMEEALICAAQPGLASLQIIFNIFRQKPIDTLFEAAHEKGIALIVRLPLASGLLAGKYRHETEFPASDHRTYNRDGQAFNVGETFAGLPFHTGVDLANGLKPLLPRGWTLAQLALRWCLDFPAVTVVIPGARLADTARANAAVSDLPPLPPDLHARLRDYYQRNVASQIRGPY